MQNNNTNTQLYGNIYVGLLTIVFITLKLTGYITWSWWWVLSPLWLPVVIGLAIFGLIFIFIFNK